MSTGHCGSSPTNRCLVASIGNRFYPERQSSRVEWLLRLVLLFVVLPLLAGCITVEKDTTQCVIEDDGFGGRRTVFDPSQTCNDRSNWVWWAPKIQDLVFREPHDPGSLVVESVYDSRGPRSWDEFTVYLERMGNGSDVRLALGDGEFGLPIPNAPEFGEPIPEGPIGLRMPTGPIHVGDVVRFCLVTPDRWTSDTVQVGFLVSHPRAYRYTNHIGPLPSCDGSFPDTRDLDFAVGAGNLTLQAVNGADGEDAPDWSEFTLHVDPSQNVTVKAVSPDGNFSPAIPAEGHRLPPGLVRIGDVFRFCLETTDEWESRLTVLQVWFEAAHPAETRHLYQVGRTPLCS